MAKKGSSSPTASSPAATASAPTTTAVASSATVETSEAATPVQIDYELTAGKKTRQYTTADVGTVRLAVAEHIVAFLTYHNVPTFNVFEYTRWAFGILIIIAGTFSYAYKHEKLADNRPVYLASALVFFVCTAAQFCIAKFVEGTTTIFISKPFAGDAQNKGKGKDKAALPIVKAFASRLPTADEQKEENATEVHRILDAREKWAALGTFGQLLVRSGLKASQLAPPDDSLVFLEPEEEEEKEEAAEEEGAGKESVATDTKKEEGEGTVKDSEAKANADGDDVKTKKEGEEEEKEATRTLVASLAAPARPADYSRYVSLLPAGSAYAAPIRDLIGARHVRLRVEMDKDSLPCLTLVAEELAMGARGAFCFWAAPRVLVTAKKTLAFGTFFDEEGFIYPPAIKEETVALLRALAAESADTKKKR